MTLAPTPGQTVGPFFHDALPFAGGPDLVPPGHPGRIRLHGLVLDGEGAAVPDALVEVWQADADGRVPRSPGSLHRDHWSFTGWGRAATDRTGRYSFSTVVPGAVEPGSAAWFSVCVFARGLLDRVLTRAYVAPAGPDGAAALEADPLLARLDAARRATLMTHADDHGLTFDIHLQGPAETVFLRHEAS